MSRKERSARPPAPVRKPPGPAPDAPWWASALTGLAFLALYLAWCPNASGDGDSSEFTVVLATFGLSHPTGYVPYTWLGHLWVTLARAAGAGAPWAANAWSAVGGACALGLGHALACRALARAGVRPRSAALLALLPALALGLNASWLDETLLAEVNSWHVAWVLGAGLFAFAALEHAARPGRGTRSGALRIVLWGALAGLGLAHHSTSVLAALPLTLALLAATPRARGAWMLAVAAGAAVVLAAWARVYGRSLHPAAVQWGSLGPGLHETWEFVTAAGYRHWLGAFAPAPEQRDELVRNVAPWLAAGGLSVLAWPFLASAVPAATRRAFAGALALLTVFPFFYGVPDPVPYFTAPLALGLFLAPGVLAEREVVRRLAWPLALLVALVVAALVPGWMAARSDRRTTFEKADPYLRQLWQGVPIRRGYVVWDSDMSLRLVQYQRIDGIHPGLVVVRPLLLMDDGARALWTREHGFDPLAGAPRPPADQADDPDNVQRFASQIADGINRSTRDSVVLFQPEQGLLRLLEKPALTAGPGR